MHADVSDCCLPISVAVTAASLHDSQVAVPLMKMTSQRVDYLYDVMDAAYDAQPIYAVSRSLGTFPSSIEMAGGKRLSPWPLMRRLDTGKGPSQSGSTAG